MGKGWPAFCAFRVSLRYRSEYRSDSPPKPEKFAHILSVQGMCQNQLHVACQPGLLSGDLVTASETYKQLEAQQHHAAPFTWAAAQPLSPQALFEHEPPPACVCNEWATPRAMRTLQFQGCGFSVVLGIVLSKQYFGGQKCSSHSPMIRKGVFDALKLLLGMVWHADCGACGRKQEA